MNDARKPRSTGGKPPRRGSGGGRTGGRGAGGRGKPAGQRTGGRGAGQRSGGPRRETRRDEPAERTADQKIYDGPPIPDDVSAKDLDRHARQALQSLPEKLQDRVARHLVMAGLLMHEDPETAHLHALAARARASRNGLIREACGETAYAAGKFAEALSEFRAARRMNGQQHYAPMMADCERALGRPEKALAYDTAETRSHLDDAGQVELTRGVGGARRDLGQVDAALRLLETEPLHSKSRADWVARLRYAYADTLLAAGRTEEAVEWFHRVVAVDGNRMTDAEDRLAELT
jgi:tetratricopeptide (TPR) repeat protein